MADCGARERPPGHPSAQMGTHRTQGPMDSVGDGLASSDPTRHRPGRPSVYEATSDGHAGWVPTKAQRPNRALCGLQVITQAAVWCCWVNGAWPRGPAGLGSRPSCTAKHHRRNWRRVLRPGFVISRQHEIPTAPPVLFKPSKAGGRCTAASTGPSRSAPAPRVPWATSHSPNSSKRPPG